MRVMLLCPTAAGNACSDVNARDRRPAPSER